MLGAAGLLKGYRSACHWAWRDMLKDFGAIPVAERVVRDRNRISGGGVTAGIDFGLTVAAELAGEEVAKSIQLMLEYDPQPPFDSGSPEKAGVERVKRLRERMAPLLEGRLKANAERPPGCSDAGAATDLAGCRIGVFHAHRDGGGAPSCGAEGGKPQGEFFETMI